MDEHPNEVRPGCVMAFAVSDKDGGTEELVVIAEVREPRLATPRVLASIARAVAEHHGVRPSSVGLLHPGPSPRRHPASCVTAKRASVGWRGRVSRLC